MSDKMGILLGQDRYLTIAQVGNLIKKSEATVYRYIKAGKLPKPTVSGLFRKIDVIAYYTASKIK